MTDKQKIKELEKQMEILKQREFMSGLYQSDCKDENDELFNENKLLRKKIKELKLCFNKVSTNIIVEALTDFYYYKGLYIDITKEECDKGYIEDLYKSNSTVGVSFDSCFDSNYIFLTIIQMLKNGNLSLKINSNTKDFRHRYVYLMKLIREYKEEKKC